MFNHLKRVASVFVEFDQKTETPPALTQPVPQPVPQPVQVLQTVASTQTQSVQASPEEVQKFFSMFETLLKTNNLQGPDFIEYEHMVQQLEKDGITDDTALKSAFIALKMQGLTKEYLLQSIKHYIEVVNKDYNDNTKMLTEKQTELNNQFEVDTRNIKISISENEKKINELQLANQQLKDSLLTKEQELSAKISKSSLNHNIYTSVYNQVIEHLNVYTSKISSKL